MVQQRVAAFVALAGLMAAGCSCSERSGPRTRDAGRDAAIDARRDGWSPRADSGVEPDSGEPDSGEPDSGARLDSGAEPDSGAVPDASPPPLAEEVRFVVLGDTGEGNEAQRAVAIAIRDLCAAEGCDFAILLGDNIYDSGVDSVDDPQWRTKFEEPYRDVPLLFYAVLGNHDYGGRLLFSSMGGLGNEFDRGPIEVEYTMRSDRWEMPATHYTLSFANVGFVMADTNSILWDDTSNGDQWAWYDGAIADLRAEGAEWIFFAGHHPFRSNGRHGNAGAYESIEVGGIEVPNPVPLLNGDNVRRFFDDKVCGTVDVVLSGHDHNRQWLDEPDALCGAELIVSGAGSKTTSFASSSNDVLYADDQTEGFLYVVIAGDSMTGRFVDSAGATAFEHMVTRTPRR